MRAAAAGACGGGAALDSERAKRSRCGARGWAADEESYIMYIIGIYNYILYALLAKREGMGSGQGRVIRGGMLARCAGHFDRTEHDDDDDVHVESGDAQTRW